MIQVLVPTWGLSYTTTPPITLLSLLHSLLYGWLAGEPEPATHAATAALSQETLAEIIRLSCIHPQAMSYLSDYHSEQLAAAAASQFTVLSRHIHAHNIPKRKGTTGSRSGAPPSSRPARRRRGLRGCHTLSRVNTV